MGLHDTEFLEKSRLVFVAHAPMSLLELRQEIERSETGTSRRDSLSALDSLARLFGRELSTIRASAKTLRPLFASKSAAQLGISEKRYANIRSSIVAALRRHGKAPAPVTKRIALTPEWSGLLASIEKNTYRMALYRLAAFCSYMAVAPDAVNRTTLRGFFEALEAEEIVKHPRRILKYTIAHWNMCARRVPGWPDVRLSSPFDRNVISLPLTAFPPSFAMDLAAWKQRLLAADPMDPNAPARPLRQISVDGTGKLVVRFASVLVATGALPAARVTGLSVLVQVDVFKAGLRFFLDRAGGKPTPYVALMARALANLAKHYCHLDGPALKELTLICKRLEGDRIRQMTPRNRERLGQFDDPENVARLLAFPAKERQRGLALDNPYRAAKCSERALAASILIHCGLRIQNLRTLMLTDFSYAGGTTYLAIDGSRVKNRQSLSFELPSECASLLKEFITEYRPKFPGADGPYLFPGTKGGPRPHNTMRHDFETAMRKHAGLVMNPHLIRHTIAKIVVERDPAMYAVISLHLGHKRIDMTLGHYLGTETRAAARHVNKLLGEAAQKPAAPKRKR